MSVFSRELDDLRREVRFGAAGSLRYAPKVDGANVVVTELRYALFDAQGASVQSATTGTVTMVTDGEDPPSNLYSLVDLSVPSGLDLAEHYRAEIAFDVGAATHADSIEFDVVRYPIRDACMLSLNDFREARPDVVDILTRQGLRLGYAEASAPVQMAAIYSVRSLIALDARLRDRLLHESASGGRPALVLNRERLLPFLRAYALREVMLAETSDPEGQDEASGLFRHYRDEAEAQWRGLGPLRFMDATAQAAAPAASVVSGLGRTKSLRRAW